MNSLLKVSIVKNLSGNLGLYIVQLLSLLLFARIFTPDEFGILAKFQVIIVFFQIMSDLGIGPAIVNAKSINKKERDGLFTFSFFIALFFSILYISLSSVLSELINLDLSDYSIYILIVIIMSTLTILPMSSLKKDLKFITISITSIFCELIAIVSVLFFYKSGLGVLSLILKPIIFSIFRFLALYGLSNKTSIGMAKFGSNFSFVKKIVSFSFFQFLSSFLNYVSSNVDKLFIANYFSSASLGMYDRASQVIRYPLLLTSFSITPALQPVLVRDKLDPKSIVLSFFNITSTLTKFSLLITIFIYFNASDIVYVLLGSQWADLIPLVELFCLMIPFKVLLSITGAFFQVYEKTNIMFFSSILGLILISSLTYIGVRSGELIFLAKLLVLSSILNFIQTFFILLIFVMKVNVFDFLNNVFKGLSLPIVSSIFYVLLSQYWGTLGFEFNSFLNVIINISMATSCLFFGFVVIKKCNINI